MKDKYGIETFHEIFDWIWDNKALIQNKYFIFDHPDYGGMPHKLLVKLSSNTVDIIQEIFNNGMIEIFQKKENLETCLLNRFFLLSQQ